MNAYEMFEEIRGNIGENAEAHWLDIEILRKENAAQRAGFHLISQTIGDWFIKKATLTPSSNAITLPADCAKPVYVEDATTGGEIPVTVTVRERRTSRLTSFSLDEVAQDAYLLEDVIEINHDNFTGNVNLWYERRIPDLHFGTAGTGSGATTLVLQDNRQHSLQDDYYNNMTIEVVKGTGAGTRTTVSDYVASTRTITTAAGTFAAGSVYGLVSELPREACDFMNLHSTAALLAKPHSNLDPNVLQFYSSQLKRASDDLEEWCSMRLKNSNRTRMIGYWDA